MRSETRAIGLHHRSCLYFKNSSLCSTWLRSAQLWYRLFSYGNGFPALFLWQNLLFQCSLYFTFFNDFFFNWRLTTLQYCSGFGVHWHESALGVHVFPILQPHPIPLGHPSAALSTLSHASDLDWRLYFWTPVSKSHKSWTVLAEVGIGTQKSGHSTWRWPLKYSSIYQHHVKTPDRKQQKTTHTSKPWELHLGTASLG